MKKYVNVIMMILIVVCKKAMEIAKHPQTKKILKFIGKKAINLLKTRIGRGIVLLYLSGLFMEMGLVDLSIACCLALIIDNRNIFLNLLGYGSSNRKRRYN